MRLPQPTHLNYSSLTADIERGRIKIPQLPRRTAWYFPDLGSSVQSHSERLMSTGRTSTPCWQASRTSFAGA
jgi:hypothetical protein